jgi:SNF2 family DNA or RNA helicase
MYTYSQVVDKLLDKLYQERAIKMICYACTNTYTYTNLQVMDRLLDKLYREGHKVLIYSQFTGMLGAYVYVI